MWTNSQHFKFVGINHRMHLNHLTFFLLGLLESEQFQSATSPPIAARYVWLLCCQGEMSECPQSWWSEKLWILSSDWRGSRPKMNGLLYFKRQTHFFPSTLSLSCILVTFSATTGVLPLRERAAKLKGRLHLVSGKDEKKKSFPVAKAGYLFFWMIDFRKFSARRPSITTQMVPK